MATYTDNYTMTKPTYAEQADISVINANMDIIDNVMHSSQISLAPAYDINETYNTGDIVMHELLMYKCLEDNVTGAWDSTKWTRTTAGEESGGGADLDIYGEASGTAEASFSDGAEASLVECEIGIVPTQDLHGYSKPWAGGAGKNKLPMTVYDIKGANPSATWDGNRTTINGVTFSIQTDGDGNVIGLNANGTASGDSPSLYLARNVALADDSYVLNGCPNNGSLQTYGIFADYSSGGNIPDYGSGATLTISNVTLNLRIRISNGYTASNLIFKPMIRLATVSDATFEPYSNICPISGHTDVTVTVASTSGGSGEDTTVSLGRTVYGGTLDVTTGVLTVDRALVTLSDVNWNYADVNNGVYRFSSGAITNFKVMTARTMNLVCSILEENVGGQPWDDGKIYNNGGTSLVIATSQASDTTQLATLISGQTCVYELATHQTFTLTKEQIQTLLGQNYVSHDGGGTISLVYIKKDSTIIPNPSDAEVPLIGLEISGKGFKITDARIPAPPTTNGAYVLTVTVSGGTPTYSWENA